MMADQTSATASVPEGIESASAKLVYLYLEVTQGATLGDICEALDLTRLTLCSILRTLEQRGFVSQNGSTFAPA